MKSALAPVAVVLAAVATLAQTPPQAPPRDQPRVATVGTAVVTGTVVADDEPRAPLRRATVGLVRSGIEDIRTTTTDDQGRYVFDGLPAGTWALSAGKGAYLGLSYGAPKPGMPGSQVTLAEGETFNAKPMVLWRGAVIAGRLLDSRGQPVANSTVEANQIVTLNGARRRRTSGREARAVTNAHGEYRIYGLLPGEYIVSTAPPRVAIEREATQADLAWARQSSGPAPPVARPFTYALTLFPGTADPAAGVPITLARGEERVGIDFALQFVPVARVAGIVTGPDGRPAADVNILCYPKDWNALLPSPNVPILRTAADGSFAMPGLIPGRYTLMARGAIAPSPEMAARMRAGLVNSPLWGLADVTVAGQDLPNVAIQLQQGMTVSGQVVLARTSSSASAAAVDFTRVRLQFLPAPGGPPMMGWPSGFVSADGTFRLDGFFPAPHQVTVTTPTGWSVRSAVVGGKDVADVPLEVAPGQSVSGLVITLTDMPTELSGVLTDGGGRPAPQLYVVVFSTDKAMWMPESRRIRSVRSGEDGAYTISGLPPGEYYLCALTELDAGLQYEAEYLQQFIPSAIKITLGEGEKKKQDLRVGG